MKHRPDKQPLLQNQNPLGANAVASEIRGAKLHVHAYTQL